MPSHVKPTDWHHKVAFTTEEYVAFQVCKYEVMPLADHNLRPMKGLNFQEFPEEMDKGNPPSDMGRQQVLERLKYWPDIPNVVTKWVLPFPTPPCLSLSPPLPRVHVLI